MAFSDEYKARIIQFLGYSFRGAWGDAELAEALTDAESSAYKEAEIKSLVDRLQQLDGENGLLQKALKKIEVNSLGKGDVVLNPDRLKHLRAEGRRLCGRLAFLLGLPLAHSGGFAGRSPSFHYGTTW